jgi:hypothetical protein
LTARFGPSWIIVKRSTTRAPDGADLTHELVWTGGLRGRGTSPIVTDAYRFSSYAAALECCGTHDLLRDSDEWKVVRGELPSALYQARGVQ